MARSSHVDDIERLKVEFNEQKKEIKEQNEAELENLRRYWSTDMGLHKKLYINCKDILFNYVNLSRLDLKLNVIYTSVDLP